MKKLLFILIVCCSFNAFGQEKKKTTELNELLSDSILWSNKCKAELSFKNLKKNKTTAFIISYYTKKCVHHETIKPETENNISFSNFKKGVYYIEFRDWTGLVHRQLFVKT